MLGEALEEAGAPRAPPIRTSRLVRNRASFLRAQRRQRSVGRDGRERADDEQLARVDLEVARGGDEVAAGRGFLPELQEGALNVSILTPIGTPIDTSDAVAQRAEEALLEDPAVISTARRTGRQRETEP